MPDSLLSLVAHPLPVAAHVVGQTLRAAPRLRDDRRLAPRFRVHRRPPGELRRDLDHRLVDQHRYRIQVTGMGFETEPLRWRRRRARGTFRPSILIVFVYRVIQRECGLKTVRNRECQGSRRGDLGWTVGFTRIVSMVTVRQ